MSVPAVFTPRAAVRGTVVVLVGRGEGPACYARLGERLAYDGYAVVVPRADAPESEIAEALGSEAAGARILLGSDSGALRAWAAAERAAPDALVLAALPLGGGRAVLDREAETEARSGCPVHRALLDADPDFRWGALDDPLPPVPRALPEAPTLVLHGERDPVVPVAAVRALAGGTGAGAPTVEVVRDGARDVLNDRSHRIVAARVVTFLEAAVKGDAFAEPPAPEPTRARKAAPLHVSARLDYALRALCALAGLAEGGLATCEELARAHGVPLSSLVNIMLSLRRAGLVTSRRGCEGGYRLARPAPEITVAEVVRATEGAVATVPDTAPWVGLERTVSEYLENRSVHELRSRP